MAIEVGSWRVVVSGTGAWQGVTSPSISDTNPGTAAEPVPTSRQAWFNGAWHETPVYQRLALPPGFSLQGPAVFEERETTVVVPPGVAVTMDALGNLLLTLPNGDVHQ